VKRRNLVPGLSFARTAARSVSTAMNTDISFVRNAPSEAEPSGLICSGDAAPEHDVIAED
jgi:hypothetical protein